MRGNHQMTDSLMSGIPHVCLFQTLKNSFPKWKNSPSTAK